MEVSLVLDLLLRYCQDRELDAEPGFKPKDVRWLLMFDVSGVFLDAVELGDTGLKRNPGRTFQKCPSLSFSEMKARGEQKSHFLVETVSVVALMAGRNDDPAKLETRRAYFIDLLRGASAAMGSLGPVADFLSNDECVQRLRERLQELKAGPADKVTIRIGDVFPVDEQCCHEWWRSFRAEHFVDKPGNADSRDDDSMICFATGVCVEPAKTHPKIEGLADVGGLSAGDVLIGFDKDAFQSYRLKQSANAATSELAAAKYCVAVNHLIKQSGKRLAGAKTIYWFKDKDTPPGDDPLPWMLEGSKQEELDARERARKLLESIRSGQRPDLKANYFYAATLSGASGRVMLRDWIEGPFDELVANVEHWFSDLAIVRRDGQGFARTPKFFAVLGATVRELDDLPPPFVAKMWRVAVRNEPIPQSALANVMVRVRSAILKDESMSHAGMGLIRAYHVRLNRKTKGGRAMEDELTADLNEGLHDPAYQCGRLLAVLAELQRSALGDVGAGVVQRYYAAASSTPSLVLGRLTRTSQFHLNKLQGDRPGLARWFENQIAGVWGNLGEGPPRTLSLEEQSLFALGYYQQLAQMRNKKKADVDSEKEEQ
jgi:CRISPR-associated protein Csd1